MGEDRDYNGLADTYGVAGQIEDFGFDNQEEDEGEADLTPCSYGAIVERAGLVAGGSSEEEKQQLLAPFASSFEAMMQQKTVCELFLGVIYKHFRQSSTDDSRKEQIDELWNSVLRGKPGFLKKVVLNANADNSDDPELRNQMEMIKK